jgi:lipid II:glycine glycyltransferase (peptidoglycan interpeptide bridge formation enzyme)
MEEMEIIDPLQYPRWDDLLLAHPRHSVFQTSHWARVLHDSYGYQPRYAAVFDGNGLLACIPAMKVKSALTGTRGVSLPFTDYCEPITPDRATYQRMLEVLKNLGEREHWKYLELRGGSDLLGDVPSSSFYYRHDLELSKNADALSDNLKDSTKRNIRKAQREGVTVARSRELDAVRTFYQLHCMTRKKHGAPPQPASFFERLYDHVIRPGHGQVILAAHLGRIIAGAVYLHFGREAVYKFGASDSRYLHLRPNDLIMWEAIQDYCQERYARFCFGRTEPDNEGLRQFKSGWGAEEKTVRYFKYDIMKKEFVAGKASHAAVSAMIFRRMPSPLLKIAGQMLYRHMG